MWMTAPWRWRLSRPWRSRIAYTFLVVAVAASFALTTHNASVQRKHDQQLSAQRRYDICSRDQRTYDGQFVFARYLGDEFHATPAQLEDGLRRLRRTLGQRPKCTKPPGGSS